MQWWERSCIREIKSGLAYGQDTQYNAFTKVNPNSGASSAFATASIYG